MNSKLLPKIIQSLHILLILMACAAPHVICADDRLSIERSNNTVVVSFTGVDGKFYQVQSSTNLMSTGSLEWTNIALFLSDGARFTNVTSAVFQGAEFFRYSTWANCILGEWESTLPDNQYRMMVTWNFTDKRFDGILTQNGSASADVGFTIGELVWTAIPTNDPQFLLEMQEYRSGSGGVSTGFFWQEGTIDLTYCTDLTLTSTQIPFQRVTN